MSAQCWVACHALGHFRPFLGPVYAWVATLDHGRSYKVPRAIALIFKFLATALSGTGRLVAAGKPLAMEKELFRTDAKAEGNEVWIAAGRWSQKTPSNADGSLRSWITSRRLGSTWPASLIVRSPRWSFWQRLQLSPFSGFHQAKHVAFCARHRRTIVATATLLHGC